MKALLLATVALSACATTSVTGPSVPGSGGLPFIEDDYDRALGEARARKLPLFVDAWAPWCHTCRYMRAFVFSDRALAPEAQRFVWLSIDTEKEKNAPFVARYPIAVWPTLMVVDAVAETAVLRWPGSATVTELRRVLADGDRAAAAASGAPGAADMTRAVRAAGEGKIDEAAAAWDAVLAKVKEADRPHAVESLVLTLGAGHIHARCAEVAAREAPRMPRGPSFANTVATGLLCAEKAQLEAAQAILTPLAVEALDVPGLLADDRSGLYELLVARHADAGELDVTKVLALRWLRFVEEEAARAPSALARTSFDPHLAAAAVAAGEPARAIAPLVQSEKDLPDDYNAPARLAMIYLELGRLDEAIAASDRALSLAYGPRRVRLLDNRATILERRGDRAGARRALDDALKIAESMPELQRGSAIAYLRKRRDALPPVLPASP